MKCECGLTYSPSCEADILRHEREHDEYLNGVRFTLSSEDEIIAEKNDLKITIVRPSSPLTIKERAEHLGRRANWETPFAFGVYNSRDAENEDLDIHAFIGSTDERAIAFMLLEKRANVSLGNWITNPVKVSEGIDRWTIGYMWVLQSFRRTGVALTLLLEASRFTGLPVQELAWYPPFTRDGEALVRSVCPDEFWIASGASERLISKQRIKAIVSDLCKGF